MGVYLVAITEENQKAQGQAKNPRLKKDEGIEGAIFILELHAVLIPVPAKPLTRI